MDPGIVSAAIEERLESVAGGVEGKIIKLEVMNLPRETYRYLDHKMIRQYRAKALNFTIDMRMATPAMSSDFSGPAKHVSLREH